MKKLIGLAAGLLLAATAFSQNIAGVWSGVLNVGSVTLPIVLHVRVENGTVSATMDSPAQGARGIPVSSVQVENTRLSFAIAGLGVNYEGVCDGDSIVGTFRQNGMSFPLNFSRTEAAPKANARPQDPVPPYPYHSEEVHFENREAGIRLAGTFTWPEKGTDFPAVALVSGSGPQNRNEELVNHRPFLVLSDYLTRHGIAVLRYDDRGVGESEGDYKTAALADFAADARAAVAYLKHRPEADSLRIGVIGHSEGGTIAFMLAGEPDSGLAYIVSMAGMAIRGDSLLRMQRAMIARAEGVPAEAVAQNERLIELVCEFMDRYPAEAVHQPINELMDQSLPDSLRGNDAFRAGFKQAVGQMSPEIRSLMACDPSGWLAGISCPVLALGGDKDLQVAAEVNLDRVKALVKGPVTARNYPGLNHLFQHCATGRIGEYAATDETISPEVLADIAAWIGRQKGR